MAAITHEPAYDEYNGALDADMAGMLGRLEPALRDAIVILAGDHGPRDGAARLALPGNLENRMPLLLISVPPGIASAFPDAVANLKANAAARLTTPYDLYATLGRRLPFSFPQGGRD